MILSQSLTQTKAPYFLWDRHSMCRAVQLWVTGSTIAGFIKFFLRRNHQAEAAFRAEGADGQCTLLATANFLEQGYINNMMIWTIRARPEINCPQWPSFQSSLIPDWNPAQYLLCTWSSSVSEDFKCYTVYLKMIFFVTESWVSHQSLSYSWAGFPLLQSNIKLCLTSYDHFWDIFEMQPHLPHLSSCHPPIPSSSPPPLASPIPFLLHRGTKPDCNYCLQVLTHSHILMEPNYWSLHNPKIGLNHHLKKPALIYQTMQPPNIQVLSHTTQLCANNLKIIQYLSLLPLQLFFWHFLSHTTYITSHFILLMN